MIPILNKFPIILTRDMSFKDRIEILKDGKKEGLVIFLPEDAVLVIVEDSK